MAVALHLVSVAGMTMTSPKKTDAPITSKCWQFTQTLPGCRQAWQCW